MSSPTNAPADPPALPSHPAAVAIDALVAEQVGLKRIAVQSVRIKSLQAVTWPDSCLGIPQDGETCADVLTPGYRIELEGGTTYRADAEGRVRRERGEQTTGPVEPDPQATDTGTPDSQAPHQTDVVQTPGRISLRYVKEGGIGGWRTGFEATSEDLSEPELSELKELITTSRFFEVDPGPEGSPTPDGVVRRLWIAVDRRNRAVVRGDGIWIEDDPALDALYAWVEQRTPPLIPAAEV